MFLGIDFGTSYSKAETVVMDQRYLLHSPGDYGLPSEFYYDSDSGILVGKEALGAGQGNAAQYLVSEIKMQIQSGKRFKLDDKEFGPEEIIREILKTLLLTAKRNAEKMIFDTDIEGIVMSVPAGFELPERTIIRDAVLSNLEDSSIPVRIIDEPVAAAIAYAHRNSDYKNDRYILVYDLGGGTCDIALVHSNSALDEKYEVIDKDMLRIGGRDWDKELEKYIAEIIENRSGIKVLGNFGLERKIKMAAREVKRNLSDPDKTEQTAQVELGNNEITKIIISRKLFDELTLLLLNQTLDCLEDIYIKNSMKYDLRDIDIICVGGSSNMLQVKEGIVNRFPNSKVKLYEPEYAVVYGNSLLAGATQKGLFVGTTKKITVTNISKYSYGILAETKAGKKNSKLVINNIIFKGKRLPWSGTTECFASNAFSSLPLSFDIYENDSNDTVFDFSNSVYKKMVGTMSLSLPADHKKKRRIKCLMTLNENGLLEFEAEVEKTRNKGNISFTLKI